VRRFVFASSSSVNGNAARAPFSESDPGVTPISPYAATKRAAELLCQAHQALHGGSVLCLRLFTVYGPRQRPDLAVRKFAALMARGEPIPCYGDGTTERDYTWVGDVVDGIVAAIDRGAGHRAEFEVVNLGSGRPVSLARLVALLGEAMRVSPVVQHLPAQAGDVERTWADITRAARLLGYRPRVGIEEGLGRFVAAWEGKRETRTGKR
jgi:UDP-glucuronate 4-epimerase